MKKILAIALALVMVLGIAATAGAVNWGPTAASSSASPFKVEVIKLGANSDVTGAKYYTIVTDAAAFAQSTIYYAVKVTVPSVSDLNAYYGNSNFKVGDKVKVNLTYTNISGKTTETKSIELGGSGKTLWLNQSGTFDETWTASLSNNCGCGNNHILSAVATDTAKAAVKACIGVIGDIKDIKIDGCYKVKAKSYYGIKPCEKCKMTNLSGFLFEGDCASNKIFFSTASNGKVTGIYVIEECEPTPTMYYGAMKALPDELYGWQPSDKTWKSCGAGTCDPEYGAFKLVKIGGSAVLNQELTEWENKYANDVNFNEKAFDRWVNYPGKSSDYKDVAVGDYDTLYYKDGDDFKEMADCTEDWYKDYDYIYAEKSHGAPTATNPDQVYPDDNEKLGLYYEYNTDSKILFNDAYGVIEADSDAKMYKMLSADTIECDTNERTFLNSVNHLLSLLGFTYADVAAGNIYMTKDILVNNFGFATGAICDERTWGAYTAAITVAAVAEVPATGSMSYVGFALMALAIAAAVVTKKVRA